MNNFCTKLAVIWMANSSKVRVRRKSPSVLMAGLCLALLTAGVESQAKPRCPDLLSSFPARSSWTALLEGETEYARWFESLKSASGPASTEVDFVGRLFHSQVFVRRGSNLLELKLGRLGLGEKKASVYDHKGSGLSMQFAKMLYVLIRFVGSEIEEHPEILSVKIQGIDVRNPELNAMLSGMGFKTRNRLLSHSSALAIWGGGCLSYYGLTGDYHGAEALAFMAGAAQSLVILSDWESGTGTTWAIEANVVRDGAGRPQLCSK